MLPGYSKSFFFFFIGHRKGVLFTRNYLGWCSLISYTLSVTQKDLTKDNPIGNATNEEFRNCVGQRKKEFTLLRSAGTVCFQCRLVLEGEWQSAFSYTF